MNFRSCFGVMPRQLLYCLIKWKPEYRGKAIGRDIVQTCERLAKGEGKGRVWCTIHAKALPVQQFFKALRYRELRPAEQENGSVPRNELVYEHTLS